LTNATHEAVMVDEVLENLVFKQNGKYVDCTFGAGGHSLEILNTINNTGCLTSIEKDESATKDLSTKFTKDSRFTLINDSFSNLRKFFEVEEVDGILIDLGISSTQLDDPLRGFSFQSNGPLDMRIDTATGQTAAEWINKASKKEIEDVLWILGQERASRRIASKICEFREKKFIETTKELSDLIMSCVNKKTKKHPATNSFQGYKDVY